MRIANTMKELHCNSGKLELIIGPMYSGKSSCLISRIRQHEILGMSIMVLTHSSDTRYSDDAKVSSHDKVHIDATNCVALLPILDTDEYKTAEVVCVEEAQFFEDIYEFVVKAVEEHQKHLIVSGLDGDFQRQPYRQILDLIPLADIVERKNALCIQCRDGTLASFSKRIVSSEDRLLIGGKNTYIPVCRFHYNHHINSTQS
jgi:thymidine kinase